MQYYVICRQHPNEKVYVRFTTPPETRSEVPASFQATCGKGHQNTYYRAEVVAEVGLEPWVGGLVGGLLFFVDPIAGVMGATAGYTAVLKVETDKVKRFNESIV